MPFREIVLDSRRKHSYNINVYIYTLMPIGIAMVRVADKVLITLTLVITADEPQ